MSVGAVPSETRRRRPRRGRLGVLTAVCGALLVAACSSGGGPGPALDVVATSAAPNRSYDVIGTGFHAGESVTVEVRTPEGKTTKAVKTATRHGGLVATMRLKASDPPGNYQVTATGNHGARAHTAVPVGPVRGTTTVPGAPSTTAPTTTTVPPGTGG